MDEKRRKHTSEDISRRMKLMAGVFQTDARILDLEKEKIKIMQQLYEQEMKMYGQVSKMGKEIFEVEHCEILNGRVRQMTDSEWREHLGSDFSDKKMETDNTVRGKLDHYKAAEKQQSAARTKEEQKRETPELV